MGSAAMLAILVITASSGVVDGYADDDLVTVRTRDRHVSPVENVEPHTNARDESGAATGERYCPPTLYTHGMLREIIYECDGAGGTEFTPVFDMDEAEDAEEGDAPQFQPIVVSREDVQSLLVSPGTLQVQPDQPWVLVNTDTIVMTDATEQVLSTRVLDLDVDVRVTPVLFTWDFGDGSAPVTGTDPGAPWPHHTVSHSYQSSGTASISLRTEWDAEFRVRGSDTWVPVLGRAVTTQATEPIEVVTATPRLTAG